jgi:hypothetical protein
VYVFTGTLLAPQIQGEIGGLMNLLIIENMDGMLAYDLRFWARTQNPAVVRFMSIVNPQDAHYSMNPDDISQPDIDAEFDVMSKTPVVGANDPVGYITVTRTRAALKPYVLKIVDKAYPNYSDSQKEQETEKYLDSLMKGKDSITVKMISGCYPGKIDTKDIGTLLNNLIVTMGLLSDNDACLVLTFANLEDIKSERSFPGKLWLRKRPELVDTDKQEELSAKFDKARDAAEKFKIAVELYKVSKDERAKAYILSYQPLISHKNDQAAVMYLVMPHNYELISQLLKEEE